jgi:hypothetical protein
MKKNNQKRASVSLLDASQTFDDHLNFSDFSLDNTISSVSDKQDLKKETKPNSFIELYGWIVFAFASSFSYTAFNTITAAYIKEDCYSAKVVNCMVLGFAVMAYRGYKKFVNEKHIEVSDNNRIVSHLPFK